LFVFLLLLFIRFLPVISIFEMRTLVPQSKPTTVAGANPADSAAPERP
jgi:hypothetical protein